MIDRTAAAGLIFFTPLPIILSPLAARVITRVIFIIDNAILSASCRHHAAPSPLRSAAIIRLYSPSSRHATPLFHAITLKERHADATPLAIMIWRRAVTLPPCCFYKILLIYAFYYYLFIILLFHRLSSPAAPCAIPPSPLSPCACQLAAAAIPLSSFSFFTVFILIDDTKDDHAIIGSVEIISTRLIDSAIIIIIDYRWRR